jgi:hypothetical protein
LILVISWWSFQAMAMEALALHGSLGHALASRTPTRPSSGAWPPRPWRRCGGTALRRGLVTAVVVDVPGILGEFDDVWWDLMMFFLGTFCEILWGFYGIW